MSITTSSETPTPTPFSNRGQKAMEAGTNHTVWDIISNKWDPETNPSGILSVGMAENTLLHDTLLQYIHTNMHLSADHLTYNNGSMGSNALRAAISHFLNRRFNPFHPVQPRHILVTNGCSSAIEHLSFTFLNPGEAVLLGKSYYSAFTMDISLRPEAVVVPVSMRDVDPLSPGSVDAYEKAAILYEKRTGKRVRAVLLCNPHNPLGRCYPRATIDRLMRLCQARKMHLISDEIYALSVWENRVDGDVLFTPFESMLSRDTTNLIDPDLLHVIWGMSKDFGANGLRVGAIISQANPDFHVAGKCLSIYTFISAMSDQITATILADDAFTDKYVATNREKLAQAHEFFVTLLNKHGIEYEHGCNAGFFVWINLGKNYLEAHPGEGGQGGELTDMVYQKLMENRVHLASGTGYGAETPGWFRVVFAHPVPWLEEAMVRILRAVG
ncbi:PLP-dependent transferase [Aspergillus sclerotiicarbonarius CBS 121057]|uniref:PLP-dependent transferase n=1 Tax=Aspergillus sclerotiicarbonarius (strain CBS 121057 / IBT 28362) TaxID=1448318 RepID=A0A319EL50_ASPSB|nr:PLP-dependent transferase [Aspergillus sclerotiicarbonarius CBS 121057]